MSAYKVRVQIDTFTAWANVQIRWRPIARSMNIINSTSVMVESMHLPLRGHMARSMNIINSTIECRGRTHLPLIDYLAVNCILYTNHLIILFHAMYIYIYVYILIHIIYNNMYACTVGVN